MRELDAGQLDEVSGALSLIDITLGWAITRSLDAIAYGIGSFAAAGVPPDYSRTTPMGDMY